MARWYAFLIVLVLFLLSRAGIACDTSLIDLLSSSSPDKEFRTMVVELASLTRSLGQSVSGGRPHQETLTALMKVWVQCSNKYGQTPPILACEDKDWALRMRNISDSIGVIKTALGEDRLSLAHENILALAGKITQLFAGVELQGMQRALYVLAEDLDRLSFMARKKDTANLQLVVERMSQAIASITAELPPEKRAISAPLAWRAQQMKEKLLGPDVTEPFVPMSIMVIDLFREEFANMNQALNRTE